MGASLPVLSIALYWMIRSGYDGFFNELGVTPEQVGISQVTMVSRSGYAIGSILALSLAVVILVTPFLVRTPEVESWKPYSVVSAGLWAVVFMLPKGPAWGFGSSFAKLLALMAIPFSVRTVWLASRRHRTKRAQLRQNRMWYRDRRVLSPPLVAVVLVVVMGFFGIAPDYMRHAGEQRARALLKGEVRPEDASLAVAILSIPTFQVEVAWLDDRNVPAGVKGMEAPLYLGEADGLTTFLDWRNHRTVRVPTGTFVLCHQAPYEDDAEPAACPTRARSNP